MPFDEPLTPEQVELLRIIWRPLVMARDLRHQPDWPVWDYLQRSLYQTFPDLPDARDVVTSLPVVRDAIPTTGRSRDYGLLWHTGHMAMYPGPEDRVGLTIAGLVRLAEGQSNALALADALAEIIGDAARADAGQPPQPFSVLKPELPLADFTGNLAVPVRERPYGFPDRLVAEVLSYEYAPLPINPLDAETGHQLLLGRHSLHRYRQVRTASDYLACIDSAEAARQPPLRLSSPLTLLQTLDYLGLVLDRHAAWPPSLRFVSAPDLQSASAVTAQITSGSDYERALSGVWNLIGHLQTPEVPADQRGRFKDRTPGTIDRLAVWLEGCVVEPAGLARVQEAISVIRQVGRLRKEPQHASVSVRQAAHKARRRLGLDAVLQDYGAAWDVITDRLAGAFEVIRQEIAMATSPD